MCGCEHSGQHVRVCVCVLMLMCCGQHVCECGCEHSGQCVCVFMCVWVWHGGLHVCVCVNVGGC